MAFLSFQMARSNWILKSGAIHELSFARNLRNEPKAW